MALPSRISLRFLAPALEELARRAQLRQLLRKHYMQRDYTAPTDRLAALVGYPHRLAVHKLYGELGKRLAKRLGIKRNEGWPTGLACELLVDFEEAPPTDASHELYWKLSTPIVRSIEQLGWVKKKSKGRKRPERRAAGSLPDPILGNQPLDREGQKRMRIAMMAERSQVNRRLVLSTYGVPYRCQACRVSLAAVYGKAFGRIIQVHHRRPLAAGVQAPRPSDFLLLCPNCHVVAHYGRELKPRSLVTLRKLISVQRHMKRPSAR